jgi:hypothetical protein
MGISLIGIDRTLTPVLGRRGFWEQLTSIVAKAPLNISGKTSVVNVQKSAGSDSF